MRIGGGARLGADVGLVAGDGSVELVAAAQVDVNTGLVSAGEIVEVK